MAGKPESIKISRTVQEIGTFVNLGSKTRIAADAILQIISQQLQILTTLFYLGSQSIFQKQVQQVRAYSQCVPPIKLIIWKKPISSSRLLKNTRTLRHGKRYWRIWKAYFNKSLRVLHENLRGCFITTEKTTDLKHI